MSVYIVFLSLFVLCSVSSCRGEHFRLIRKSSDGNSYPAVTVDYKRNVSGWNYLEVASAQARTIEENVRFSGFAGILEGIATCTDLETTYPNFYADNFGKELPSKDFLTFIIENYLWMVAESEKNYKISNYWLSVKQSLTQLHGILIGYENSPCKMLKPISSEDVNFDELMPVDMTVYATLEQFLAIDVTAFSKITFLHLLLLNSWGDIYSIESKFDSEKNEFVKSNRVDKHSLINNTEYIKSRKRITYPDARITANNTKSSPVHEIQRDLRCSSFFKLLPDNSDIVYAHATWGSYIALSPRIFKHYTLPSMRYTMEGQADSEVIVEMRSNYFSSSPGNLASLDDFYIINSPTSDLVVIETTNDMMNPALHDLITPQHNLCWMRTLIANQLATTGASWAEYFKVNNSGTYTNQWQVMDMTKFRPGETPSAPGLFTVLEEVPGTVVYADLTAEFVNSTHWGSYNIPYFESIYIASGNKAACDVYSAANPNDTNYCYPNAPRANIFRARQGGVKSYSDVMQLIQYNDWRNDPLSLGDSCKSIACRRDLETDESLIYPSGALDAKVSSYIHSRSPANTRVTVRIGPTKDSQPVFCWSSLKEEYMHLGQPDCFDFDWLTLPVV